MTLNLHCRHDRVHLRTSLLMLGHTYRSVRSFCVARIPGWEREWSKLKTAWQNSKGTTGRATPVDVSQRMVNSHIGNGTGSRVSEVCEDRKRVISGSLSWAEAIA